MNREEHELLIKLAKRNYSNTDRWYMICHLTQKIFHPELKMRIDVAISYCECMICGATIGLGDQSASWYTHGRWHLKQSNLLPMT